MKPVDVCKNGSGQLALANATDLSPKVNRRYWDTYYGDKEGISIFFHPNNKNRVLFTPEYFHIIRRLADTNRRKNTYHVYGVHHDDKGNIYEVIKLYPL